MDWGRIVVPVTGGGLDAEALAVGVRTAERFKAELAVIYAPPDPSQLTPWLGEGVVGGVQVQAIETLREAAHEGEGVVRAEFEALSYPNKQFQVLETPVWRAMAVECRLADLVIFGAAAARGEGPLAETFELVLMEERAAVLVARAGPAGAADPFGPALVAWDGGEPASRAARRAVPLLRHASSVTIAGAPPADRRCALEQLQAYYVLRGIKAAIQPLNRVGDMAPVLMQAAQDASATLMVAGAFGRSRLREFVFGGTTRALLHAEAPSLFVAH